MVQLWRPGAPTVSEVVVPTDTLINVGTNLVRARVVNENALGKTRVNCLGHPPLLPASLASEGIRKPTSGGGQKP
eukprot:11199620-Lingulodinium_polyedra.AAC.1